MSNPISNAYNYIHNLISPPVIGANPAEHSPTGQIGQTPTPQQVASTIPGYNATQSGTGQSNVGSWGSGGTYSYGGGAGTSIQTPTPTTTGSSINSGQIITTLQQQGLPVNSQNVNNLIAASSNYGVYYSSNPNFIPKNQDSIVIYTDKSGALTGRTSQGDLPSDFKNQYVDTTELAKQIKVNKETNKVYEASYNREVADLKRQQETPAEQVQVSKPINPIIKTLEDDWQGFVGGSKAFWNSIGGKQIEQNFPSIKNELGINTFQDYGAKAIDYIQKIEDKEFKFLIPQEGRMQQQKSNLNNQIVILNTQAKELQNTQVDLTNEKQVSDYNKQVTTIENRYKSIELQQKYLGSEQKAYENSNLGVVSGIFRAGTSWIIDLPKTAIGLATNPVLYVPATIKGIIDMPKEFISSPAKAAEITTSLVAQGLIFEGLKGKGATESEITKVIEKVPEKLTKLEELKQYGVIGKEGETLFPKTKEALGNFKDYISDKYSDFKIDVNKKISIGKDAIENSVKNSIDFVQERKAVLQQNILPIKEAPILENGLIGKQSFRESYPNAAKNIDIVKNYISDKYDLVKDTINYNLDYTKRKVGEFTDNTIDLAKSPFRAIEKKIYENDLFWEIKQKAKNIKTNFKDTLNYEIGDAKVRASNVGASIDFAKAKVADLFEDKFGDNIYLSKKYISEKTDSIKGATKQKLFVLKKNYINLKEDAVNKLFGIKESVSEGIKPLVEEYNQFRRNQRVAEQMLIADDILKPYQDALGEKVVKGIDTIKGKGIELKNFIEDKYLKANKGVNKYLSKIEARKYKETNKLLRLKERLDIQTGIKPIKLEVTNTALTEAEIGNIASQLTKDYLIRQGKVPSAISKIDRELLEGQIGTKIRNAKSVQQEALDIFKEKQTADNIRKESLKSIKRKTIIEAEVIPKEVQDAISSLEKEHSEYLIRESNLNQKAPVFKAKVSKVSDSVDLKEDKVSKAETNRLRQASLKDKDLLIVEYEQDVPKNIQDAIKQLEIEKSKVSEANDLRQRSLLEKDVPIITFKRSKNTRTFFHATSDKYLSSILKDGLQPSVKTGISQGIVPKDFVSASKNLKDIEGYGIGRTAKSIGGNKVILQLDIPERSLGKLLKDSEAISGVEGEVRFKEVPRRYIKVYKQPSIEVFPYTTKRILTTKDMFPETKIEGVVESGTNHRLLQRMEPPKEEAKISPPELEKDIDIGTQPENPITGNRRGLIIKEDTITPKSQSRMLYALSSKQELQNNQAMNNALKMNSLTRTTQQVVPRLVNPEPTQTINQLVNLNVLDLTRTNLREQTRTRSPTDELLEQKYFKGLLETEEKKRRKQRIKQIATYAVQLRRRGKYQTIATNLSRGEALRFGNNKALNDLARTFKIVESGKKEVFGFEEDFMPSEFKFRNFQIRKGKQIALPNTFIQLNKANLQSSGEKFQIAEAKRMKKLMSFNY